jgi:murein L,D-transpeptidase YafK
MSGPVIQVTAFRERALKMRSIHYPECDAVAEHKQAIIRAVSDFALHMPRTTAVSLLTLTIALAAMAIGSAARAEGSIPSSALVSTGVEASLPMADQVVVSKGERKLFLMRQGEVLRTFRVALGLNPEGHKQFEGDYRTPEGKYRLTRRNPNSEYFLSIQIDYPNDSDMKRARRQGQRPGGAIMIHGQPNVPRKPREYYTNVDWTEGCIAVSNSDMVEIWLMTPPDTPIEIRP